MESTRVTFTTKTSAGFAYADTCSISTSQDYKNIYVSMNSGRNTRVNVKVRLQEHNGSYWITKEEKNGGLAPAGGSANVTFYNYSTAGSRKFRAMVYL